MLLKDVSALKEVPMFNGQHDPQNANEHFIYGIKSVMEYIDNMPIVCTGCDKCHEKMVRYGFKIYKTEVEGRVFWVAESEYLKGCVGQGESIAEALSELAINEEGWLAAAEEHGIEIPKEEVYSYEKKDRGHPGVD